MDYGSRLQAGLEQHRHTYNKIELGLYLVETFKIINGKYSIHSKIFFEFDDGNRRGHSKKLFKRSRLNLRMFIFGNRVVDYWNGLSDTDSCVNCSTINEFKSKIKVELELEL